MFQKREAVVAISYDHECSEKFFHSRGTEAKIYSILFDSSNFFSYWLTLSTAWNHKSQGCGWLMALFISADTVCGGIDLSLTHSMQEMVPETSSLLVPLLLQPVRAGRWGIQLRFFCWNTFPVWQSDMESEWGRLISCSTPSLPDQCGCTAKYMATCSKCFPRSLS